MSNNQIRVVISRTWKSYSPRASWELYDQSAHLFDTLSDAKEWLRENVPKGKRHAMYQDTKSRGTIRCGYIVGFRLRDYGSRGERLRHLEQWWIEFQEVTRAPTQLQQGEVRSIAL